MSCSEFNTPLYHSCLYIYIYIYISSRSPIHRVHTPQKPSSQHPSCTHVQTECRSRGPLYVSPPALLRFLHRSCALLPSIPRYEKLPVSSSGYSLKDSTPFLVHYPPPPLAQTPLPSLLHSRGGERNSHKRSIYYPMSAAVIRLCDGSRSKVAGRCTNVPGCSSYPVSYPTTTFFFCFGRSTLSPLFGVIEKFHGGGPFSHPPIRPLPGAPPSAIRRTERQE